MPSGFTRSAHRKSTGGCAAAAFKPARHADNKIIQPPNRVKPPALNKVMKKVLPGHLADSCLP
jgi:hypothetical protein